MSDKQTVQQGTDGDKHGVGIPSYYAEEHAAAVADAVAEGAPLEVFPILDRLTDEERVTVFRVYCIHCGSPATRCYCMADD